MEFQTSNFNIMIKREDSTVYYPSTRMEIDLFDGYPNIEITGDTLTSEAMRLFTGWYHQKPSPIGDFFKKWRQQTATSIQLGLQFQKKQQQQPSQQKIKIPLHKDIIEIFNDAEFLVTFQHEEEWETDRITILNGIITKLKMGATELEMTLAEQTTKLKVATLKLLTAQNAQIRALTDEEFPYKAGYSLKDVEDKTYYLMSHEKQMTLSRARFYTQITMGVGLEDVIKVMAILTDECRRCAEHLDPKDAEQLKIFPEIITRVSQTIGIQPIKDHPIVYIELVLFIYTFRTKEKRKAAPFIVRHSMVHLLNLLEPEQLILLGQWIDLFGDAEFTQYTEKMFKYLKISIQAERNAMYPEMVQHQNLSETTIFKFQNKMVLFEFRYMFAFLEKWYGGDRLLTFAQLKGLPQIGSRGRPPSYTQIQTFL
jgi:hypothetical protein